MKTAHVSNFNPPMQFTKLQYCTSLLIHKGEEMLEKTFPAKNVIQTNNMFAI